ncbi:MAG: ABC transporter ATP-binding protein [Candidatus Omnitrophica bacterium]|nr:ABC transporter ATP-binding protein [Candidatus Omnitrophota bacterium]
MLKVRNLKTYFYTQRGTVKACDDISFDIDHGRNLGLVGESGCGKSMCCLSILKLIPPEGNIVSGEVLYKGRDILSMDNKELRKIRGNKISMIFQEPMTSLNPVLSIGEQMTEAVLAHKDINYKEAKALSIELLSKVKIDRPKSRFSEYPHNLSGGMRQRVMIAMAISCRPDILIADEPTTALDVTIQAGILELLDELQNEYNMSVLIVSHDFGVIARLADRVAVMYAGEIVEYAGAEDLFKNPLHLYTKGLLSSIKQIDKRDKRLSTLKGAVCELDNLPKGCRFSPRCDLASSECREALPELKEISAGHFVRCVKS